MLERETGLEPATFRLQMEGRMSFKDVGAALACT
jgi:hypothetical protein